MRVERGQLPGVMLFTPEVFEDHRGRYVETFNERAYADAGVTAHFVQDDVSTSRQGVLRGLHGDDVTWKLVSCLRGALRLVVVDCRRDSQSFAAWEAHELSEESRLQVLVPPGFANGHLVLTEVATFHYKQSSYYPTQQFSHRWDDPAFGIDWPAVAPILSDRDRTAPLLSMPHFHNRVPATLSRGRH